MLISIFGYLFFLIGLLILVLPLLLVELSRPRDWLMGGLFLFLGLFLLVEYEILRGSLNLLIISMTILYGKLILEIFQNRWYQLSSDEKKQIGSFQRWLKSCQQLVQSFALMGNALMNFFKGWTTQSEKAQKEKKWVHPELKEEGNKKAFDRSVLVNSNKVRNQGLPENEKTS